MPGDRIIVDGLWRCLCPSIDLASLSKPIDLWHIPRIQPASLLSNCDTRPKYLQKQQCRRQYSQAAALPEQRRARIGSDQAIDKSRVEYLKRLAKRSPWIPGAVLHESNSLGTKLDNVPTRDIYAALREFQVAEGAYFPITRLVEYLVKERGERPNAALYEGLVRANIDKHYGSAKVASQLLREVQSNNIPTTLEFYQALLEVAAVHPDYVLRAQTLHDMKNRWYGITPSTETSIILGLLRDGQYELAFFKLEELNKNPINVPPWLYDIFLYTFGELGFHEEVFSILKHRLKLVDVLKRGPLSLNAWHFLLDVFSRDAFQPGIKFVWGHSVSSSRIQPPDGVVLNVLNAASMHRDTTLVMAAIQELSARGIKLSMHHYEALIHVHAQHDNLQNALAVLCIMAKAGLPPDLACTRPIFQILRSSPTSTDKALSILHELKGQYAVPPAAFNVILESTAAHGGFRIAFDLYRTIRQVCIHGPDLETFELLFRCCTQRKSMNFLVAEMEAFSLKPSRSILDHLIRICSIQDDYAMAFRYLDIMRASTPPGASDSWWMSKSSALALLRRCIQARDRRSQGLFEECRRRRLFSESDIKSLALVGAQYEGVVPSRSYGSRTSEQDLVPSSMSA